MDTTMFIRKFHHLVVFVRSTNSYLMHGKCIDDGLDQIAKSIPRSLREGLTYSSGRGGGFSPNLVVEHLVCENAKRLLACKCV